MSYSRYDVHYRYDLDITDYSNGSNVIGYMEDKESSMKFMTIALTVYGILVGSSLLVELVRFLQL